MPNFGATVVIKAESEEEAKSKLMDVDGVISVEDVLEINLEEDEEEQEGDYTPG